MFVITDVNITVWTCVLYLCYTHIHSGCDDGIEKIHSVGINKNAKTSYFTQLKYVT